MSIKILHIISSLKRGGRERQLSLILKNTEQVLYPSKIIYFNESKNSYIDEYKLRASVLRLKSYSKLARLRELHRIIKDENPDIIYAWGNGESISIFLLAPFHHFKFINGSLRYGIRSRRISHYFRTVILKLSHNVVANSYAGLRTNKLGHGFVLSNGVEQKFLSLQSNKERKREELLGILKEAVVLISVANLVPYKDYISVLNALKRIKNDNITFYYLILGDGPLRNKIEDRINENDLTSCVRIIGNVQNVTDYLEVSDIFIHSSKGEGCSNAILEAMAAGLPIIASSTGGTPEIVTTDNGLLFEYKNVEQLYEVLKSLIHDNFRTMELGRRSKEIIKSKFTLNHMMNNYYIIIDEVMDVK